MVINGHSDFLVPIIRQYEESGSTSLLQHHRGVLETGKVDVVLCAVGGDGPGFPAGHDRNLAYVRSAVRLAGESAGAFQIVHSVAEMREAKRRRSVALLLGLEGGHALEGSADNLLEFYRAGLRWLGLTWNGSNELGDGCGETAHGGLTDFGREIVLTANRLGILIDLSHASRKTFDDAIQISRVPMIASHSNSAVLRPHPRNLTDEQIRRIAAARGVIGINFFPCLLAQEGATGRDILAHMLHIAGLVGFANVALGPDFVELGDLAVLRSRESSAGVDYGTEYTYPPGFSDESCFPAFRGLLAETGVEDEDISQAMGGNVLALLGEVERSSNLVPEP